MRIHTKLEDKTKIFLEHSHFTYSKRLTGFPPGRNILTASISNGKL